MLKNISVYFIFRIGNGVASLAMIYFMTRLLSVDDYGKYTLGISVANLVAVLGFQWINVSVGRYFLSFRGGIDEIAKVAHNFYLMVAAIIFFGACLIEALKIYTHINFNHIIEVVAVGLVFGLHGLHMQIHNAKQNAISYGYLTFSRAWLSLALSLLMILSGFGVQGAFYGVIVAGLFSLLLFGDTRGVFFYRGRGINIFSSENINFIRFGLPLSITYLSMVILDTGDRFMINYFYGAKELAPYSAAFDFNQQTIGAILNIVYLAGYPKIIIAWESGDKDKIKESVNSVRDGVLLIGPLVCVVYIAMASDICNIFFGDAIAKTTMELFPWIALAALFGGARAFLFDISMHLSKKTRLHVITTTIMAVTNIILNIILIPSYGAYGAAVSIAISFGIGVMFSIWFGRSADIFQGIYLEILKCSICMGISIISFNFLMGEKSPILIKIIVLLFIYISLAFVVNLCGIRVRIKNLRIKSDC